MCLLSAYCGLKINLWLEDSWRVTFDVSEVIFFKFPVSVLFAFVIWWRFISLSFELSQLCICCVCGQKTFAFLSLMAKVQAWFALVLSVRSWKHVAQGKYIIETCTTGFTEKWAFDVMTDDFWICIRKSHYLKLLLLWSIFSLALVHVLNKNNITGLPIAWMPLCCNISSII